MSVRRLFEGKTWYLLGGRASKDTTSTRLEREVSLNSNNMKLSFLMKTR